MAFRQRINIFDTDQTTISGGSEDVYDIAFIPGFANIEMLTELPADPDSASAPDTVIVHASGTNVFRTYQKVNDTVASAATWATHNVQVIPYGSSTPTDFALSAITPLSGDVKNSNIAVNATARYVLDDEDRNIVSVYVYVASSATGTDNATCINQSTPIVVNLWSTQEGYTACTTIGALAVLPGAGTSITIQECTAVATFSHKYELVNTEAVGAVRFNTYADFTAATGTAPACVWQYKVDGGTPVYSFKSLYDFASGPSYANTTDTVALYSWISTHLAADDAIRIVWVDRNWLYAAELLRAGLPVFYCVIDGWNEDELYDNSTFIGDVDALMRTKFIGIFQSIYAEMADKGEYDFKYLTTGAFGLDVDPESAQTITISDTDVFTYPFYAEGSTVTRTRLEYLADVANYRKDCLVLADAMQSADEAGLKPSDAGNVYTQFEKLAKSGALANLYSGEVMTKDDIARAGRRMENTFPWVNVVCNTFPASWGAYRVAGNVFTMPGSFAYLSCVADALQKYPTASWQAIAGVTRALVPNFVSLDVNERLSNAVADAYNQRNRAQINAITNIRPYGYAIWGNGTLVDNEYFSKQGDGTDGMIASSFVDIMSMVCNVNKVAYRSCKRLMFEKNNDVLWTRFRQGVEPYLDSIVTGGGLRTYELKKIETEKRGHLIAKIILYPVYSLDSVDVEIILRDTETQA